MRPFAKGASVKDSWPSLAEVSGQPLGLTMGWVNFPYLSKGTFTAGPVALQVHKGDEHAPVEFTARGSTNTFQSSVPVAGCDRRTHGNPSFCPIARMPLFIASMSYPNSQPMQRNTTSPRLKFSAGISVESIADTRNTSPIRAWALQRSSVRHLPIFGRWAFIHLFFPMFRRRIPPRRSSTNHSSSMRSTAFARRTGV